MTSSHRKIVSHRALLSVVRRLRRRGRRIVFTNGCFDLLHVGHVTLLERAKRLGDVLVVAINSDRSVRALKGAHRPIMSQRDRARLLAALASVDYVTVFNESTPLGLIRLVQPDILVKGTDWSAGQIVGGAVVRQRGGRVVRLPLVNGYSTTELLDRIGRLQKKWVRPL